MLSIIVTILKIIGIILLIILGILLLLLLSILFVPVRYRAEGYYRETYAVKAKVTWFFHLLSALVTVEEKQELHLLVKVLGIPIYDNHKSKKKERSSKKKTKKQEKEDLQEELQPVHSPEICSAEMKEHEDTKENKVIDIQDTTILQNNVEVDAKEIPDRASDEVPAKKRKRNRMKEIFLRIVTAFRNIQYTFERMCAKIKYVKDNITYYLSILQSETTKQAFALCQKQIKRIFKNIKPQKYAINLRIGMDDPATLGQILGIWGMLYPLHQGNIDIDADFEKQIFEGDFFLKGRISIYVYVWTVYLVLFDKNIKQVRKCFKREEIKYG